MGLGPQGLREGCELRDAKPFPADVRGEAADPDSLLDVLFRVQAGQGGGEAVGQGLSALGEGGPDHPKEVGLVIHLGRGGPGRHPQDGGGHLGCGDKAGGGDLEEQLRGGVVLAEDGEGPVIRCPRPGADTQGHLSLNHDGDGGEDPRLDQGGDGGGGNIIRKIGTGQRRKAGELFRCQGSQISLQDVSWNDLHIFPAGHGL